MQQLFDVLNLSKRKELSLVLRLNNKLLKKGVSLILRFKVNNQKCFKERGQFDIIFNFVLF